MLVEARAPELGLQWQRLKGFRINGSEVKWTGCGGEDNITALAAHVEDDEAESETP